MAIQAIVVARFHHAPELDVRVFLHRFLGAQEHWLFRGGLLVSLLVYTRFTR